MGDHLGQTAEIKDIDAALALIGLGRFEMWVRYFSLGGCASPLELDAFFNRSLTFSDPEYNIVAQALNERLIEIGVSPFLPQREGHARPR